MMSPVTENPVRRQGRILGATGRNSLRGLRREVGCWPVLMRVGLGIFAVGGLADVVYHAVPAGSLPGPGMFWAHLVTLVGMILTMLGILTARRWKHSSSTFPGYRRAVLKILKEV